MGLGWPMHARTHTCPSEYGVKFVFQGRGRHHGDGLWEVMPIFVPFHFVVSYLAAWPYYIPTEYPTAGVERVEGL